MSYFLWNGQRIFYEESGAGAPVLLLHGNSASSNMFYFTVPAFSQEYRVIVLDFLGHGLSDRLPAFPADLWYFETEQVIAFLREQKLGPVRLIGTSGGALVAMNVALEAPELIESVVADSFEGKAALPSFTDNVVAEREATKRDPQGRQFFEGMHGEDWEAVVDNDTRAIAAHAKSIRQFFHKPLSELTPPILLTGSREDEYVKDVREDYFTHVYGEILREIGHGEMHLFENGGHPAMLSNQEEFFAVCKRFWGRDLTPA